MKKFEILDETLPEVDNDDVTTQKVSPVKADAEDTARYQKNKDRYKGDIDPVTKLRTGIGAYTYTNPYFQYQGQWVDGKKQGHGTLLMRDGSQFVGDFVDGEITGSGTRSYEDGTRYCGNWLNGEKEGYGEVQYGRRNVKEAYYKGEWRQGLRHGNGELGLKNQNVIKGIFENNQPHGECQIEYKDGSRFKGNLNRGIPDGQGVLIKDGFVYTGNFVAGKREGNGVLAIENNTYCLKSVFVNDYPEFECNKFTLEIIGPKIEEIPVDPKAKPAKDAPKPATKFTEQEEATYGPNKIYYEFKRGSEHQSIGDHQSDMASIVAGLEPEIQIKLTQWYQGPEYVDPNPPEEVIPDPKTKKAPVKGAPVVPDEPAPPRMITPAPVLMSNESGRKFRFELGRFEKDNTVEQPSVDQSNNHNSSTVNKDQSSHALIQQNQTVEQQQETHWVRYYFNQKKTEDDPFEYFESKDGVCMVEGIKFRVNDDLGERTVKVGTYELRISEVTKGLPPRMLSKNSRILIKFADLDEEAAAAAALVAAQAASKGGAGKKK